MPTYEYICGNCGHHLEKFQMMSASPIRKCPKCGKMKLKRLIGTGAGIIFKGPGFYETDYRSDSYDKDKQASKNMNTAAPKDTKSKDNNAKSKTKKKETKRKSQKKNNTNS